MLATGAALFLVSVATVAGQSFTPTSGLISPRTFHTATLLTDGRVLVVGGADNARTAELFDPSLGFFLSTGNLTNDRTLHTATIMLNGQVLIAGGIGSATSAELYDPTTGIFSATGTMASPRSNHTATRLLDGQVLFTGGSGEDGLPLSTAELYNAATGIFTPTGALVSARQFHAATVLTDGRVLITGGAGDATTAELYDPPTGTFAPIAAAMIAARSNHTATLLSSGQVLIAGGTGSGSVTLSTGELFDPTTMAFRPTNNLAISRSHHRATLLTNGQVLFTGSLAGDFAAELFDPFTGTFSTTANLTVPRSLHTATRLSTGQVLIAGGFGASTTAELFDFQTLPPTLPPDFIPVPTARLEGVFTATNDMTVARQSHAATLLANGRVLITGGLGGGGSTAELFDTASDVFMPTSGSMTAVRIEHTAVALSDGRVLVAGGSGAGTTAELFDPVTATFSATGGLTTARNRHAGTLLSNDNVLIAGGVNEIGMSIATAELFDPATGTFTTTGSLAAARSSHTATRLSDGRVLVSGGLDENGVALATAELYDPATGSFTATGMLTTARSRHTATLMDDGHVLLAGGFGAGATAEIFEPTFGTFTATSGMTFARASHTATLLEGGQVLLAGGVGGGATAEVFDDATASFSAISSLTTPRQLHTATLLDDGRVLVTGGLGILSTAELFTRRAPDLVPIITKAKLKPKGTANKLTVKTTIMNRGAERAPGPFSASLFLSADEILDAQDTLVQTIEINKVNANREKQRKFKVLGLGNVVGMFAIVDVDPVSGEDNSQNNSVVQVIAGSTAAVSVTVIPGGAGSGVVSSSPEGVSCGITCVGRFAPNATVLLTATASSGSLFGGWSGDVCNVAVVSDDGLTGTCQFVPVLQDRTVFATFEPVSASGATLVVSTTGSGTVISTPAGTGIVCGTDCTETVTLGTVVTLQAIPDAGSSFAGWSGGGCIGVGFCSVTMTQGQSVVAQFQTTADVSTAPLTVTKLGTGSGTVTSVPGGISCGVDCTEAFPLGQRISLLAAAGPNSTFAGWTGGGCVGTGSCSVTMTQAQTVTAEFTTTIGATVTLTVREVGESGGRGNITGLGINCGSNGTEAGCTTSVATGASVTLTATPTSGSIFIGWGGACTGVDTCTVTMTQNQDVIAVFGPENDIDPNTSLPNGILAVAKAGSGTGTVTGEGINCGPDCSETLPLDSTFPAVISLLATPAAGSTFSGWSGGGCSGVSQCVVTFTDSVIVTAIFN